MPWRKVGAFVLWMLAAIAFGINLLAIAIVDRRILIVHSFMISCMVLNIVVHCVDLWVSYKATFEELEDSKDDRDDG